MLYALALSGKKLAAVCVPQRRYNAVVLKELLEGTQAAISADAAQLDRADSKARQ